MDADATRDVVTAPRNVHYEEYNGVAHSSAQREWPYQQG
jgi:hypothetical protein